MLKKLDFNLTITNIFIILSFVWTILYYLWFSKYLFLKTWVELFFVFFISTFFHWWILHFIFNSVFLFYFWNIVELNLWKVKYILFFVFTVFFESFLINYIKWFYNVVWISWFCMAILAYYSLDLKEKRNPEYKTWILFLIINIFYWLSPWISFYWHLFWAIAWVIFYYLNKEFLRKKMVWAFSH